MLFCFLFYSIFLIKADLPTDPLKAPFFPPVSLLTGNPADPSTFPIFPPLSLFTVDPITEIRREAVKEAFLFAWINYEDFAWTHDELAPITQSPIDSDSGGLGVTLIDALDTILIMGLQEEIQESINCIQKMKFTQISQYVSVFEITKRYLGGFLSAYILSRNEILLNKAKELAERLILAFPQKDDGSVVQKHLINLATGQAFDNPTLAEVGSVQLEFKTLSYFTGNYTYWNIAEQVEQYLIQSRSDSALKPTGLDVENGYENEFISFGGNGGSYYEYVLKQWVQNVSEIKYREEYERITDELHEKLLRVSTPSNLLYLAETDQGVVRSNFDHSTCFVPGMLALGVWKSNITKSIYFNETKAQRDLHTAQQLAYTCYQLYQRMPHSLVGESVTFTDGIDFVPESGQYLLRPETIESFFLLYRITQNETYRDWAWDIFVAINQSCRFDYGFSGLTDINASNLTADNHQQSGFLAETLKYLYLIFSPPELIPLESYVFNTGAHPLVLMNGVNNNGTNKSNMVNTTTLTLIGICSVALIVLILSVCSWRKRADKYQGRELVRQFPADYEMNETGQN